jgi:hypothetical protein
MTKTKKEELAEEQIEERKKKGKLLRDKIIYYIDEGLVLLLTVIAVVFSDALMVRIKGEKAATGNIFLDSINIIISILIAIVVYSLVYIKSRPGDKDRPPFIKRAANSILNGIAWRTIAGWAN